MPLQDLTPQLRTRLNRMERAVGWFILLATLLLIVGFGFYIYHTAEQKGWFKIKAPFHVYAKTGAGMKVGDPVKLIGFDVGHITEIIVEPVSRKGPRRDVDVRFNIEDPKNFGFIWSDGSVAQFADSGLLGGRGLNVTKGTNGYTVYITKHLKEIAVKDLETLTDLPKWRLGQEIYNGTNLEFHAWTPLTNAAQWQKLTELGISEVLMIDSHADRKWLTAVWNNEKHSYERFDPTNSYELPAYEPPSLSDRAQALVSQIEVALPNILRLTNQLAQVLSNSAQLTANLNLVAQDAHPVVANLATITGALRNPNGSLGDWLIPTNLNQRLDFVLLNANGVITNANGAITTVNTNLLTLNQSLENLAGITSNLNQQVQVNTNILAHISDIVVHSDQFIQGLKHHWLLRSAFKTNAPPALKKKNEAPAAHASSPAESLQSPKAEGERP